MKHPKNHDLPFEYLRWKLVEATGWTLEQVDALTMQELNEWRHYRDGIAKAETSIL